MSRWSTYPEEFERTDSILAKGDYEYEALLFKQAKRAPAAPEQGGPEPQDLQPSDREGCFAKRICTLSDSTTGN